MAAVSAVLLLLLWVTLLLLLRERAARGRATAALDTMTANAGELLADRIRLRGELARAAEAERERDAQQQQLLTAVLRTVVDGIWPPRDPTHTRPAGPPTAAGLIEAGQALYARAAQQQQQQQAVAE